MICCTTCNSIESHLDRFMVDKAGCRVLEWMRETRALVWLIQLLSACLALIANVTSTLTRRSKQNKTRGCNGVFEFTPPPLRWPLMNAHFWSKGDFFRFLTSRVAFIGLDATFSYCFKASLIDLLLSMSKLTPATSYQREGAQGWVTGPRLIQTKLSFHYSHNILICQADCNLEQSHGPLYSPSNDLIMHFQAATILGPISQPLQPSSKWITQLSKYNIRMCWSSLLGTCRNLSSYSGSPFSIVLIVPQDLVCILLSFRLGVIWDRWSISTPSACDLVWMDSISQAFGLYSSAYFVLDLVWFGSLCVMGKKCCDLVQQGSV